MKTKSLILILSLLASTSLFSQIPSYVPTNGLVGYWPFNGNANDESGNGNHGMVNGATLTTDRNGNANKAYDFQTIHSVIDLPEISTSLGAVNSSATYSIWFLGEPSSSNNTSGVLLSATSAPYDYQIRFEVHRSGGIGPKVYYRCPAQNNEPEIVNNYNTANWHNIIVTVNGVLGQYNYYFDGVLIPQMCFTFSGSSNFFNQNRQWKIGTINPWPSAGSHQFYGKIDDIGIWNRALTQQEITALYQSNTCSVPAFVPTNGLVGYWPFCGNANDVSGNGNNGTVNGATITSDRNGNANDAYSFNGVSSGISLVNSNLPIGNSSRSIAVWFKMNLPLTNPSYASLIRLGNNSTGERFGLQYGSNSLVVEFVTSTVSIPFVPDSSWHQMVVTYPLNGVGSNSIKIYLDGILASNYNYWQPISSLNTSANPSNGLTYSIGELYNLPGYFWDGKLDDIGIWNRALTQQEITALYNSTTCTKPEPVTLGTDRSTKLCPNEAVTIEIVTPSTAGLSYEWTRNGTTIPGATASSISVSDAAKYKVFVRSGPGLNCQRVSGLIETTAAIPPTITATTPNGNAYCPGDSVLMSATGITPGYSYQWKRFGVPIAGATSATFYAKQTGNYRCEVSNAGGCINQSNLVNIVNGTSCRIMQDQPSDVNVYPNPAKNSFTVSFNDIGHEIPVSIELRNMQGQSIENRKLNGLADVQFNVGKLSPGMYMIRVMLESGDAVEKSVMVE